MVYENCIVTSESWNLNVRLMKIYNEVISFFRGRTKKHKSHRGGDLIGGF